MREEDLKRRPHGYWERTGPYGELESGMTLSCCHCRKHWEVKAGSGRKRGWCGRCVGYTCGSPACDECLPFEARLLNVEAGRPERTPLPVKALIPDLAALAGGVFIADTSEVGHGTGAPGTEAAGGGRLAQEAGERAGQPVESGAPGDAAPPPPQGETPL